MKAPRKGNIPPVHDYADNARAPGKAKAAGVTRAERLPSPDKAPARVKANDGSAVPYNPRYGFTSGT